MIFRLASGEQLTRRFAEIAPDEYDAARMR
jgi:hypothetical protein